MNKNNKALIPEKNKKMLFLDLLQNNKINNKNNHSHVVSNTDINLNSIIKVNIKLNKKKDYTPMNNRAKKRKVLKTYLSENKTKINKENSKSEDSSYNYSIIIKIIKIQKWWKKIFARNEMILKVEYFCIFLKRLIYTKISKLLNLYYYNIYYYFHKWNNIVSLKRIISKIIFNKHNCNINNTININRNDILINYKNINNTGYKKQNYLKRINHYNPNLFKKIDHKFSEKKIKNRMIESLLINNNNNIKYLLNKKSPTIQVMSSRINTALTGRKKSTEKSNANNKLYSSIGFVKNYKPNYNTIDTNNANIFNSNKKPQCNKEMKKFNSLISISNIYSNSYKFNSNYNLKNINRVKKINKTNKKNGNKNIKQKINEHGLNNNDKYSNKKIKKEKKYFYSNITSIDSQNKIKNDNNIFKKKLDFLINDFGNNKKNITENILTLNTEPNNKINNNINNINKNKRNADCYLKTKKKIIKDRHSRLKKFDTCPLSLINNKNNLYKNNYIKSYFNVWKKIVIQKKIIYNLIKSSKQKKLKKLFFNKIINILLMVFKKISLKKYLNKYKDIITRIIIIKKIKLFFGNNKTKTYNSSYNKKKGVDIINNININNYINYTNNETNNNINNFIPKTTKNYDIFSNQVKINNYNNYNNYSPSYSQTSLSYMNNFDNFNIISTNTNINNVNIDLNKNYNINNNNYSSIYLDKVVKKNQKSNLIAQINQFRMVFNLIEQHYINNKASLYNCFKKWKNYYVKKLYKTKMHNLNKKKINEKVINFKKIKVHNKNSKKKIEGNNKDVFSGNNNIKKSTIKKLDNYLPLNDLNLHKYIKINKSSIYSDRQFNTIKIEENYDSKSSMRNNMKIRYIDNNYKNFGDNSSESSIIKNKINSEIIYQKKKLNYNHILNINNFSNNNLIEENKYHFKKLNKIEEREVHFNSLNKNRNNAYNKIFNNLNNFYNNIDYYSNVSEISNNNLEVRPEYHFSKNKTERAIINKSNNNNNNNIKNSESLNIIKFKDNDNNKIDYKKLFNNIKNIFSKNKKRINKKVNQTFCCILVNNLQDEFD